MHLRSGPPEFQYEVVPHWGELPVDFTRHDVARDCR